MVRNQSPRRFTEAAQFHLTTNNAIAFILEPHSPHLYLDYGPTFQTGTPPMPQNQTKTPTKVSKLPTCLGKIAAAKVSNWKTMSRRRVSTKLAGSSCSSSMWAWLFEGRRLGHNRDRSARIYRHQIQCRQEFMNYLQPSPVLANERLSAGLIGQDLSRRLLNATLNLYSNSEQRNRTPVSDPCA